MYSPAVKLAVNGGAVATPPESVPTYASRDPLLAKMPLAPLPGASKLTVTPARFPVTGQPFVFASATCKLCPNCLPSWACWPLPLTSTSSFG